MYEHVDWMNCKSCGNTNTLFKIRIDSYFKKKTGGIRYKTTQKCKLCYLEDNRIKAMRYQSNNKDLIALRQNVFRINNKEFYNKRARDYYKKHRLKRLEQKKFVYESKKKSLGIIDRIRKRDYIRSR